MNGLIFFNGIKIDEDNVVIDGNGHTINAKGKTRIFNITGKNITVKNIIFKNGFCREGGAIYNSGEMDIHDCTFMNNKSDDEGGAIKNNGKLNVSNSSLDSNESVRGGGIYNYENCFLHLDNCTFSNNRDAVRNMGKLIVQSCTFSNNTGSAMHNEGEVTIDDSSFFGNTSKFSGGAIYNSRRISIRKSSFKNNKAGEKYLDDIYNDGNLLLFKLNFSNQFKTIFNRNVINASKYLTEKIYCESSGSRGSISGHEMIHEVNLLKENQKDFTYLNNLIANGNGEIKLKEDILLNPINKEEITFNEGIRIERDNLTIDGMAIQ